jgi:hypothetical protein
MPRWGGHDFTKQRFRTDIEAVTELGTQLRGVVVGQFTGFSEAGQQQVEVQQPGEGPPAANCAFDAFIIQRTIASEPQG